MKNPTEDKRTMATKPMIMEENPRIANNPPDHRGRSWKNPTEMTGRGMLEDGEEEMYQK